MVKMLEILAHITVFCLGDRYSNIKQNKHIHCCASHGHRWPGYEAYTRACGGSVCVDQIGNSLLYHRDISVDA